MHPVTYWRSLTASQKRAYAKRLDTSVEYIRAHIFPPPHRKPDRAISARRLQAWVDASAEFGSRESSFSLEELLAHLSSRDEGETAA